MIKCDTIVIFSGYNSRAVMAFLRTLKKNNVEDYVIVAAAKTDNIFKTDYSEKVIYVRENAQLDIYELLRIIDCVKSKLKDKSLLLLPSTEYLNRLALMARKQLEMKKCYVPLVKRELYEMVSDKLSFRNLCKEYHILVPESIEFPEKWKDPFVAKPQKYFSSRNEVFSPILIINRALFNNFKEKYCQADFSFEEFLTGRSFYLLYYFTKEHGVYKFSQENYIQQPHGKSILCAKSSDIHTQNISNIFEKMFSEIGYHGFIMIEVRFSKDKFYMIEANPRLWGPSQLFCDAGVNFFEIFLNEFGFISIAGEKIQEKQSRYFWNGGYMQTVCRGEKPVYYNYSEKQLANDYLDWLKNDVYNRPDSWELFLQGV